MKKDKRVWEPLRWGKICEMYQAPTPWPYGLYIVVKCKENNLWKWWNSKLGNSGYSKTKKEAKKCAEEDFINKFNN